jgi:predicted ATP-dependent endonuclease of OLD family
LANYYENEDEQNLETLPPPIYDRHLLFEAEDGKLVDMDSFSSGEKQLLVIMLTVLVENREHYALLMDEPEISLHIEWQQQLIGLIRKLNPNAQIILSTHSPALIMDGWMDVVTEVNEITN